MLERDTLMLAINGNLIMKIKITKVPSNKKSFGGWNNTHGGDFSNGLIQINEGGLHSTNPYDGVPMGVDPEGVPNLVEEGEVIFNDYVFSNRLKVPKMVKKKYKLGGSKPLTFADAALKMSKESEERPNDSISQRGLEDSMIKLIMAQEEVRGKKNPQLNGNRFDEGGDKETTRIRPVVKPMHTLIDPYGVTPNDIYTYGLAPTPISKPPVDAIIDNTVPYSRTTSKNLLPTWSRYLPAYASGIMSLTDALGWTNKPDYSEADAILEASREAGTYSPIKFRPIGNYLKYEPFDVDRTINKMSAQAGATRRNLMNTSGGNSAKTTAGLLAADYNSLNAIGDLAVKARESNLDQRYKVEDYNRATDMYNHTGAFNADRANQEALLSAKNSYLKGALAAAETRQKERQLSTAARSANLSNFINSWGDIGRENFTMNMINDNPALYYYLTNQGGSGYKGTSQRAEGGLLTIKKRKRRK